MVGVSTAFFTSDWLEGLSSDWLFFLELKRHITLTLGYENVKNKSDGTHLFLLD
jgi:hypothetical protein